MNDYNVTSYKQVSGFPQSLINARRQILYVLIANISYTVVLPSSVVQQWAQIRQSTIVTADNIHTTKINDTSV
jgi:hypothetical protein